MKMIVGETDCISRTEKPYRNKVNILAWNQCLSYVIVHRDKRSIFRYLFYFKLKQTRNKQTH